MRENTTFHNQKGKESSMPGAIISRKRPLLALGAKNEEVFIFLRVRRKIQQHDK